MAILPCPDPNEVAQGKLLEEIPLAFGQGTICIFEYTGPLDSFPKKTPVLRLPDGTYDNLMHEYVRKWVYESLDYHKTLLRFFG